MASPQIENGYIQIATGKDDNDLLNAIIKASLNATEYQIVLAVIRKTYGWKKKEDWISWTQLEKMTGKSRVSVYFAIKTLVKKNILVKKTTLGKTNIISLNKHFNTWNILVKKTKPVKKTKHTSKENLTGLVKKTEPTKETVLKETTTKESIDSLTQENLIEISNKYQVPLSFVLSKKDDLENYCLAHGKKYKNYKAALSNWVKKDAMERIENANSKSKITFIDPA
jgi:phage replication O-like protein O